MHERPGLDLTPRTVEKPYGKRHRYRHRVLLLVVLLAVVSVGVGWIATRYMENLFFPLIDGDRCAVLAPGNCSELSLQTVERIGRIDLPDDSKVLRAFSASKFAARSAYALVQLPAGADIAPPPGFESRTGEPPSMIVTELFEEVGVAGVNTSWNEPGQRGRVWIADEAPYLVVAVNR